VTFEPYLNRWNLVSDGEPITTHSSDLLPVRQNGAPAMLKVAREAEERRGPVLMEWWDGEGAARVLAHDDPALLLERAMGHRSLLAMAHDGRDDEASRILCEVAARLHAPRQKPYPDLIPLRDWFAELWPAAARLGGGLRLERGSPFWMWFGRSYFRQGGGSDRRRLWDYRQDR
jgi:streptomycin 6-kinase